MMTAVRKMQWFAFRAYNEPPFIGFGSRTDAAQIQEYLAYREGKTVRFREISAEIARRAFRRAEVIDLSGRLVDIGIAEEVDHGDYNFEEEEEIDVT